MVLSNRFQDALVYAARLHADQKRKGSHTPYVAHLLCVAGLALENGADEDEAIAALLHDAVEDQGGKRTLAEIRSRFGERVADIVLACTDNMRFPKSEWRKRKEDYLEHLEDASPSVLLVSSADKLHNARSILADYRELGENLWNRFRGGKEGTLWYYRSLVDVLSARRPGRMVDELERVVTELEDLSG